MSSKASLLPRLILSLTLLAAAACHADVFDDLEVHGFATQGYVKTSDNRFFGDSDDGSFEFREIGINATVQAYADLRLSGQLLSRKAGDMYDGSPSIDFAVADYTLRSDEDGSIGLMAGRLKNPLGLYNETRDVAFTRPGFIVPQVIYFDRVRNLLLSFDGVGSQIDWYADSANINLHLAAGRALIDENVEYAYLGTDYDGDLEPGGVSLVGRLLVSSPDEQLRAALSVASTSMEFQRGRADPIGDGEIDIVYAIASLQYGLGDWTFTAEYMREPIRWDGFAQSLFADSRVQAEGYYVQLTWQAGESIEWLLRYGEGFADRRDRSGKEFAASTGGFVPAHTRYSRIWTAGLRWDLSDDLMVRTEYQRHNGTFILSPRENPVPGDMDPDWDMFALSLSYRF